MSRSNSQSIANMVMRGVLKSLRETASGFFTAAVRLVADQPDGVQHFTPYGWVSKPKAGADAMVFGVGGAAEHLVAIFGDRRLRIEGMEDGEIAMVDDQGRKIWLRRDRVVVDAPLVELGADATLGVARTNDAVVVDDPGFNSWVAEVHGKLNALLSAAGAGAIPPPVPLNPTGKITGGSSKVKAL